LRADPNVDNLVDFYYHTLLRGKPGEHGMGANCYGKAGQDSVFKVPVGTLIYRIPVEDSMGPQDAPRSNKAYLNLATLSDDEADALEGKPAPKPKLNVADLEFVTDLTEPGQEFVLCRGGDGGKGNVHFKNSRNRTPTEFTEGTDGESGSFVMELRKIADAGLVGYPNAGKSTLLTRISAAHPKIAAYPFTTLTPHIGVMELPEYRRVTVADIPGLIEGAHDDVGLGHDFLRHIVRCKLLVFVIDMAGSEGREPIDDLQKLRRELDLYDPTLSERPWVIVANKMDLPEAEEKLEHFRARFPKIEVVPISAEYGEGVSAVKEALDRLVK
jgi:GTP-binding protein